MMQFLFFGVSILVLAFGHYFGWLVLSKSLFSGDLFNSISLFVFIFFFCSMLISSYLIHEKDTKAKRVYYLISSIWGGVLVNFILSFVFIFFLSILLPGIFADNSLFTALILFFTLAISVYGVYNAFSPKLINYELEIEDLPEYWEGKTVVQISDVHLGPIYRQRNFSRAINRINALNPEAVFITGDLFDGMDSDFMWLQDPFAKLKAKQGVYYSFGNHDLYLGFSRVKQLLAKTDINILDNKMVVVEGLQFIGINYSFNRDFNLYQAILDQVNYDKAKASILLYHEPKNIQFAKDAGIDLQLSGHTHNGQIFPFNLIARLAYKGYGQGLFKLGNFNLIVNSGLGTWGPPMRTVGRGEISQIKLRAIK